MGFDREVRYLMPLVAGDYAFEKAVWINVTNET